jgi:hypothetical protein
MMTREEAQAAAKRCRAAGLAYLVLPPGDDDLPRLLIPGGADRSEYEFSRTTLPVPAVREVVRHWIRSTAILPR